MTKKKKKIHFIQDHFYKQQQNKNRPKLIYPHTNTIVTAVKLKSSSDCWWNADYHIKVQQMTFNNLKTETYLINEIKKMKFQKKNDNKFENLYQLSPTDIFWIKTQNESLYTEILKFIWNFQMKNRTNWNFSSMAIHSARELQEFLSRRKKLNDKYNKSIIAVSYNNICKWYSNLPWSFGFPPFCHEVISTSFVFVFTFLYIFLFKIHNGAKSHVPINFCMIMIMMIMCQICGKVCYKSKKTLQPMQSYYSPIHCKWCAAVMCFGHFDNDAIRLNMNPYTLQDAYYNRVKCLYCRGKIGIKRPEKNWRNGQNWTQSELKNDEENIWKNNNDDWKNSNDDRINSNDNRNKKRNTNINDNNDNNDSNDHRNRNKKKNRNRNTNSNIKTNDNNNDTKSNTNINDKNDDIKLNDNDQHSNENANDDIKLNDNDGDTIMHVITLDDTPQQMKKQKSDSDDLQYLGEKPSRQYVQQQALKDAVSTVSSSTVQHHPQYQNMQTQHHPQYHHPTYPPPPPPPPQHQQQQLPPHHSQYHHLQHQAPNYNPYATAYSAYPHQVNYYQHPPPPYNYQQPPHPYNYQHHPYHFQQQLPPNQQPSTNQPSNASSYTTSLQIASSVHSSEPALPNTKSITKKQAHQ